MATQAADDLFVFFRLQPFGGDFFGRKRGRGSGSHGEGLGESRSQALWTSFIV
jgi:hypothetical protein